MATPISPLPLPAAAFCPICLELLRHPVSIRCGHHFCRPCLERRWEWSTESFSCPRCRRKAPRRSIRPSPELARLLEIARRLSRGEAAGMEQEEEEEEEEGCGRRGEPLEELCEEEEEEEGCRRRGEPLEELCEEEEEEEGCRRRGEPPEELCEEEDGAAICRRSRAQRVREIRAQLESELRSLREEREKLLRLREEEMRRNSEILAKTQTQRQRILSQFQTLRQSLEEHSCHLLALLGHLERDIGELQEDKVTSLTQQISRLETRGEELEEKLREKDGRVLRDINTTLSRLEKENFQLPSSPPAELKRKIRHFREKNVVLEEILRNFQDILMFELPEKMWVTLEPSSAHPLLRVAPDGTSVSWESDQEPAGDRLGTGMDTGTGQDTAGDRLGTGMDTGTGQDTAGDRLGTGMDTGTGQDTAGDRLGTGMDTGTGQDTAGDRLGTGMDTGTGQDTAGDTFGSKLDTRTDQDPARDRFGSKLDTGTGQDTAGDRFGTELDTRTDQDPAGDRLGHGLDTGTGQDPLGDRFGPELDTRTGPDLPRDRFGSQISTGDRFGPEVTPSTGPEPPLPDPLADPSVLGREAVAAGRHCWDVQVSPAGCWALGVAGVTPEGDPEGQLWSLGCCWGQFWALSRPERIPLTLRSVPSRVRVALDFGGGRVAFFDGHSRRMIFAFRGVLAEGQSVRPWFLVWGEGARLELSA